MENNPDDQEARKIDWQKEFLNRRGRGTEKFFSSPEEALILGENPQHVRKGLREAEWNIFFNPDAEADRSFDQQQLIKQLESRSQRLLTTEQELLTNGFVVEIDWEALDRSGADPEKIRKLKEKHSVFPQVAGYEISNDVIAIPTTSQEITHVVTPEGSTIKEVHIREVTTIQQFPVAELGTHENRVNLANTLDWARNELVAWSRISQCRQAHSVAGGQLGDLVKVLFTRLGMATTSYDIPSAFKSPSIEENVANPEQAENLHGRNIDDALRAIIFVCLKDKPRVLRELLATPGARQWLERHREEIVLPLDKPIKVKSADGQELTYLTYNKYIGIPETWVDPEEPMKPYWVVSINQQSVTKAIDSLSGKDRVRSEKSVNTEIRGEFTEYNPFNQGLVPQTWDKFKDRLSKFVGGDKVAVEKALMIAHIWGLTADLGGSSPYGIEEFTVPYFGKDGNPIKDKNGNVLTYKAKYYVSKPTQEGYPSTSTWAQLFHPEEFNAKQRLGDYVAPIYQSEKWLTGPVVNLMQYTTLKVNGVDMSLWEAFWDGIDLNPTVGTRGNEIVDINNKVVNLSDPRFPTDSIPTAFWRRWLLSGFLAGRDEGGLIELLNQTIWKPEDILNLKFWMKLKKNLDIVVTDSTALKGQIKGKNIEIGQSKKTIREVARSKLKAQLTYSLLLNVFSQEPNNMNFWARSIMKYENIWSDKNGQELHAHVAMTDVLEKSHFPYVFRIVSQGNKYIWEIRVIEVATSKNIWVNADDFFSNKKLENSEYIL